MTDQPPKKELKAIDGVEPVSVLISEHQEPIPVILEQAAEPKPPKIEPARPLTAKEVAQSSTLVTADMGTVKAPTTTEEQNLVTAGQRRVNILWEVVQGIIAVFTTATTVYVLAAMVLGKDDVTANQLVAVGQLVVMATLILSFYFSRTNHTATGGTGAKPEEPYKGR